MSEPSGGPPAIVVPGPSLRSEGITRSVISTVKAATEAIAGATDAIRSLAR